MNRKKKKKKERRVKKKKLFKRRRIFMGKYLIFMKLFRYGQRPSNILAAGISR